jgi:diguanylate cyclase (GGDEF)-like protein
MKWITTLFNLLLPKEFSAVQLNNLNTFQRDAFKIRQIDVASHLLLITQPFNIFLTLLMNFLFLDVISDAIVGFLTLFILLTSVSWLIWAYCFWIKRTVKKPTNAIFMIHYLFSALLSLLIAILCAYFFVYSNYDQRLLITAIYTGMICGGAFVLSTLPIAAFIWVASNLGVFTFVVHKIETPNIAASLSVLLVLYSMLILLTVMLMYRMYLSRLKAESETQVEKKVAEKQKQMVDLLLKDFDEHVNDWLWELDKEDKIINLSPKLKDIIAVDDSKMNQMSISDLFGADFKISDAGQEQANLKLAGKIAARQPFSDFIMPAKIDGQSCWLSLTAKPLFDEYAEFSGWRGFCSDVTVEYTHKLEIERLANYDSLTLLPNRYYFSKYINTLTGMNKAFSISIIDLDNFKEINDKFGHAEGDLVLQMVAQRLSHVVKKDDLLARLGGDEFILLSFHNEQADAVANNLLAALNRPFQLSKACVEVRGSIGVSFSPQDGVTEKLLFSKADMAMYTAKKQRGSTCVFFDETIEQLNKNRNNMIDGLKSAINNNELSLVFQPQVDVSKNEIMAFEALLRWQSPSLGFVSPVEFIPVAEEIGEILSIGEWVLQQACLEAAKWPDHIRVAVNVSGLQFVSDDFIDVVLGAIKNAGLSPSRLELEVTESAIIKDMEIVNKKLALLQDMDIHVALDDFGTGFSSLSYLQRLSIDTLKVDRAFVMGLDMLGNEYNSKAIIDIIVRLSRVLGLNIMVEGVETEGQLEIVRELGCHNIQGYLISRPLVSEDAAAFITKYQLKAR